MCPACDMHARKIKAVILQYSLQIRRVRSCGAKLGGEDGREARICCEEKKDQGREGVLHFAAADNVLIWCCRGQLLTLRSTDLQKTSSSPVTLK